VPYDSKGKRLRFHGVREEVNRERNLRPRGRKKPGKSLPLLLARLDSEEQSLKRMDILKVALATAADIITYVFPPSGRNNEDAAPIRGVVCLPKIATLSTPVTHARCTHTSDAKRAP